MERIENIAVIGLGTMGLGIGCVAAQGDYKVLLIARTQRGIEIASAKLSKMMEGGIQYTQNLKFSLDLNSIQPCQLIIEAIPEQAEMKKQLLNKVSLISPRAIIASTTSSIPITELSIAVEFPERFIGLHFFNPVQKSKIVEVIKGNRTSAETFEIAINFVKSLNKFPVAVKDAPGFASSRMIVVYINEAIKVLEEGIASKEDIDRIAKLAFGHPVGPLKLADFIGLDVVLDTLNSIYARTQQERYRPSKLLEKMVRDGKLGMKREMGFYEYGKREGI
ncbi:MAG: 3-hydroxyacyl-CoA dehydrogenase family protein [Methanocellales archaeon]